MNTYACTCENTCIHSNVRTYRHINTHARTYLQHKHAHKYRHTDTQRLRQTDREAQTERPRSRVVETQRDREKARHRNRDAETDRQTRTDADLLKAPAPHSLHALTLISQRSPVYTCKEPCML